MTRVVRDRPVKYRYTSGLESVSGYFLQANWDKTSTPSTQSLCASLDPFQYILNLDRVSEHFTGVTLRG